MSKKRKCGIKILANYINESMFCIFMDLALLDIRNKYNLFL